MSVNILAHRVAVKPFDVDEWDEDRKRAKKLGFALPELENNQRAKASVDVGTVVQVGPTAETTVQVGDVIAYVKNAGKFVVNPFTQEEVYILNDEDVLAVLNKE
jgi:co-chaperonin GroES (HSP10)